ncbi:MAG: EAL domain-containing protein [Gammaproteobacteria bacterium]
MNASLDTFSASHLSGSNQTAAALEAITAGLAWLNTECRFVRLNPQFCELLGYSEPELLDRPCLDIVHAEDQDHSRAQCRRLALGEIKSVHLETRYLHKDGRTVWVECAASALQDGSGQAGYLLTLLQDTTARKSRELLLEGEQRILEHIVGNAPLAKSLDAAVALYAAHAVRQKGALLMLLSEDSVVLNPVAGTSLSAECRAALANLPVARNQSASGRAAYYRRPVISKSVRKDLRLKVLPGVAQAAEQASVLALPILSAEGRILGTFAVYGASPGAPHAQDRMLAEHVVHLAAIALQHQRSQSALERAQQHDELTGLPNRGLLHDRVELGLARARRERCGLALLFINVDGMHHVNETLGHEAGDQLLKNISGRLRELLCEGDTLARSGGDEFALLLENLIDEKQLLARTETLLATCAEPMHINGREIAVSVTLGATLARLDNIGADDFLRQAYIALQHARSNGHNTLEFYSANLTAAASPHLSLAAQLRHALQRGEFQVHYQPQVDLQYGRIVGAEALLRWQHPERGLVSPTEFIPVLEESGLINPVGDWVIDEVGARLAELRDSNRPLPHVAINLSARRFRHAAIAKKIDAMLVRHHLPASALMLELTETLVMHDTRETIELLQTLHEYGLRIAVDDFGTGYSSLSYLKHLPLDVLKIDKKFVDEIATSRVDAAIVSAIIMMAHDLSMRVVAEGVETYAQLDFLRLHACDQMQGYLFSKPLPFAEFSKLLASGRRLDLKPHANNLAPTTAAGFMPAPAM